MTRIWYLAYGSNLQPALLGRYIDAAEVRESHWLRVPYALYFAGVSAKWGGSVAFLSLDADPSRPSWTRAYAVTAADLEQICLGENGVPLTLGSALDTLEVGEWAEVDMAVDDPQLGKYNAVLRGPDIDGSPSYTVTGARELPIEPPPPAYVEAIRTGLLGNLSAEVADAYLAGCLRGQSR